MFSARAFWIASLRRGFIFGSGMPVLAATVISRASLPKTLERRASAAPFLCMMFLNWECPAMARRPLSSECCRPGLYSPGRAKGSPRRPPVAAGPRLAYVTAVPETPRAVVHRSVMRAC